nr:protein kinase CK2 catalytic subunit CK2 [Hymenolepis microstoma]
MVEETSREVRKDLSDKPPIPWSDEKQYKCGKILGFGRLGAVYECKNLTNPTEKLAIKIYCNKDMRRFVKEVSHINKLQDCPNVIKLFGILEQCRLGGPCIILDHFGNASYREFANNPTAEEIPIYMRQLMNAICACHEMKLMHRDIRPDTVLIDRNQRLLRLTDFGTSAFYVPGSLHSIDHKDIYYEAPELLLENAKYDFSIDMWAYGCLFAALVLRDSLLFYEVTVTDKLLRIIDFLGIEGLKEYADRRQLSLPPNIEKLAKMHPRISFISLVKPENSEFVNLWAIDLIERILKYDPVDRFTAQKALFHCYFQTKNKA